MKSLDWPYPSVLAGSLRSLLGKQASGDFSTSVVQTLKAIGIAGPLPCLDGELYFPAAKDLLVFEDDAKQRQAVPLRPQDLPKGGSCNPPGRPAAGGGGRRGQARESPGLLVKRTDGRLAAG